MISLRGFHAVARFGLGARPGEIEAASGDPQGWVAGQLDDRSSPPALADLPADALDRVVFPGSASIRPLDGGGVA